MMSGVGGDPGIRGILVRDSATVDTTIAVIGGLDALAGFQVGPHASTLVTRPADEVMPASWSLQPAEDETVTEDVTVLLAGESLATWSDPELQGGRNQPAIHVEVECQAPSTVEVEAGREVLLFDSVALDEGIGIHSNRILGTFVTQGHVERTFASAGIELLADIRGEPGVDGSLAVTAPNGTTTWDLSAAGTFAVQGPPGDYQFEVERTNLRACSPCADHFWVAALGLQSVAAPQDFMALPKLD
jgi:hypothetical protein